MSEVSGGNLRDPGKIEELYRLPQPIKQFPIRVAPYADDGRETWAEAAGVGGQKPNE
jgi:hypothetical protein